MKFFIIYTWLLDYFDYWYKIEHFNEVRIVSKMNPPRDYRSDAVLIVPYPKFMGVLSF